MSTTESPASRRQADAAPARSRGRRSGGRAGRKAAREAAKELGRTPFLTRTLKPLEVMSEEGMAILEANADRLLAEVGIEVVNFDEALEVYAGAGAEVDGTRVRFPDGMCRKIIQATAPAMFTQHARNPEKSVVIGGDHMVLVPTYGSPFVSDLEGGRRYATMADFEKFVKLGHMSPELHHGGGTLCEPVDLPVNKRHYDMVYAHIKHSDQAFMGSVTRPERARDSVDMARIVFGDDRMETDCVIVGLCNANSPMSVDYAMLGSAHEYAKANQAVLFTPFILSGAMAPVTVAAAATQTLAEAMAGLAYCQIVRPGSPMIFGSFAATMSMQTGAPTFGTPESQMLLYVTAAMSRRLGVPFRGGGSFTSSKSVDYHAAYESAISFMATMQAGVNFNVHTAGWLEGGLTISYEKYILDADQASMSAKWLGGVGIDDNQQAMDALLTNGPGQHFLGHPHTLANFETAFWSSSIANHDSYEQWSEEGAKDSVVRASEEVTRRLDAYEAPGLDAAIDAELTEWIDRRKAEFEDSDV